MATMTLHDLSKKMRDIDFTMLFTRTSNGAMAGRPMSNNRDVDYAGDSYFFTLDQTRTARDIAADPAVAMSLQSRPGLLGGPPLFIAVEGRAELVRDRTEFEAHWTKDLDMWFEDGVNTPGLVMIRVRADRLHYWDGQEEGEIVP